MIAIGVVPARGGSKGIPRKNITMVAGKPLLAYTAEAALKSRRLSRCLLSTDDEEIASVGRKCGLEVPFLRPPELATDATPTIDVLIHVAQRLAELGIKPDALVLLQPTAPLRTADDIDAVVGLLAESGADSVVSVTAIPSHYAMEWQLALDHQGTLSLANGGPLRDIVTRRQLLKKSYYRNGAVYAIRSGTLLKQRNLYGDRCLGYVMPVERSVNIDCPDDLVQAERILSGSQSRESV